MLWDWQDKAQNPDCSAPQLLVESCAAKRAEDRLKLTKTEQCAPAALLLGIIKGWGTLRYSMGNLIEMQTPVPNSPSSAVTWPHARRKPLGLNPRIQQPTWKGIKEAISPAWQDNLVPPVTLYGPALCVCVGESFQALVENLPSYRHIGERRFP